MFFHPNPTPADDDKTHFYDFFPCFLGFFGPFFALSILKVMNLIPYPSNFVLWWFVSRIRVVSMNPDVFKWLQHLVATLLMWLQKKTCFAFLFTVVFFQICYFFVLFFCSNIFKSFHGAISPSLIILFITTTVIVDWQTCCVRMTILFTFSQIVVIRWCSDSEIMENVKLVGEDWQDSAVERRWQHHRPKYPIRTTFYYVTQ